MRHDQPAAATVTTRSLNRWSAASTILSSARRFTKPGSGTADVTLIVNDARVLVRSVGFGDVTVRAE